MCMKNKEFNWTTNVNPSIDKKDNVLILEYIFTNKGIWDDPLITFVFKKTENGVYLDAAVTLNLDDYNIRPKEPRIYNKVIIDITKHALYKLLEKNFEYLEDKDFKVDLPDIVFIERS